MTNRTHQQIRDRTEAVVRDLMDRDTPVTCVTVARELGIDPSSAWDRLERLRRAGVFTSDDLEMAGYTPRERAAPPDEQEAERRRIAEIAQLIDRYEAVRHLGRCPDRTSAERRLEVALAKYGAKIRHGGWIWGYSRELDSITRHAATKTQYIRPGKVAHTAVLERIDEERED